MQLKSILVSNLAPFIFVVVNNFINISLPNFLCLKDGLRLTSMVEMTL